MQAGKTKREHTFLSRCGSNNFGSLVEANDLVVGRGFLVCRVLGEEIFQDSIDLSRYLEEAGIVYEVRIELDEIAALILWSSTWKRIW